MEGVVGSLQSISTIRVVEEEGMCACESEWRGWLEVCSLSGR